MSVLDHAIWWQVYPLGACGAPIRPGQEPGAGSRLGRLEAWLPYVVELGCSGLLLGPVFASSTHGYDTTDHFQIDPRLGTDQDWERFVAAVHDRGLLLMLDGVFNHVGAAHPMVADGGPVRRDGDQHRGWEGHPELAELDHDDPRVAELVVDVMRCWLDRGADGWRLDVAYAVPGWFWSQVLAEVRRTHPGMTTLGEVIHGDYAAIAQAGTLDAVTGYELWKAIWSAITDRNAWELAWAMERHHDFSARLGPDRILQTFVGNHDVTRVASQVGDTGAALAAAVLLTVPGMPSVYYGDEQGFRGVKGEGVGADDPVRPELPPAPAQLAPYGWWLYRLHQELIALRRRNPWLTRGDLSVLDKTNTCLTYQVAGAGHRLEARLDLDQQRVEVRIDQERVFAFPGA